MIYQISMFLLLVASFRRCEGMKSSSRDRRRSPKDAEPFFEGYDNSPLSGTTDAEFEKKMEQAIQTSRGKRIELGYIGLKNIVKSYTSGCDRLYLDVGKALYINVLRYAEDYSEQIYGHWEGHGRHLDCVDVFLKINELFRMMLCEETNQFRRREMKNIIDDFSPRKNSFLAKLYYGRGLSPDLVQTGPLPPLNKVVQQYVQKSYNGFDAYRRRHNDPKANHTEGMSHLYFLLQHIPFTYELFGHSKIPGLGKTTREVIDETELYVAQIIATSDSDVTEIRDVSAKIRVIKQSIPEAPATDSSGFLLLGE